MPSPVQNPPAGTPRIVSMLACADAAAAIEFLCRALGFELRYRLDMPDGRVGHAELGLADGVGRLASGFEGLFGGAVTGRIGPWWGGQLTALRARAAARGVA